MNSNSIPASRGDGVSGHAAGDAAPYFWTWVETFPFPGAIVAQDATILWANPAAVDLMAEGADLVAVQGRLVCPDKSEAPRLRALLTECARPTVWALRAGSDRSRWVIRAEPLRPSGMQPAVSMLFYPAAMEARTLWADIEHLFRLTHSEAQVIKHIVKGAPAEAVAKNLGVSVETVRTHIRRVYSKLSITSREQLFALISPFNAF